jgi:hypothetical protein
VVLEVKWSFEQKTYVYLESVARLMVSSKNKIDNPREDKGGSKLTILEASGSSGVAFFLPSLRVENLQVWTQWVSVGPLD